MSSTQVFRMSGISLLLGVLIDTIPRVGSSPLSVLGEVYSNVLSKENRSQSSLRHTPCIYCRT